MPETSNPITIGNTAFLNMLDERYLVEIRGAESNRIWVSFPGEHYPLSGVGGRLEFHQPTGFCAYNVQVLSYAEGNKTGIILERSESADQRTHRTTWRVPTSINAAVSLEGSDHRFSAVLENISAEGALLRAHPVMTIRTSIVLAFALDQEHGNQQVEGRVCYSQEADAMANPPIQQYGVRFTNMSPDTKRLLTLFLYHHVRRLYPKDVAAMYPRTRRR